MSIAHGGSFLAAVLLLSGVAFYNGYPLLYPDSISYIVDAAAVVRAFLSGEFSDSYGMRSIFYSVSILPVHRETRLWPVVFMHAALVALVIAMTLQWLGVATSARRYLGAVFLVAALSTAGWEVAVILPDVLTAPLILCTILLAFPGRVSWHATAAAALISGYAILAHLSHLLLAIALLCVVAGARLVTRTSALRIRVAPVAGVIGCALLIQLGAHAYLFGRPMLSQEVMPFLLARAVHDGTVEPYLRAACGTRAFALCQFRDQLPSDMDTFLWGDRGVWAMATPEQRQQLLAEEAELVRGAVQTRPVDQAFASLTNVAAQLVLFDVRDLARHPYVDAQVNNDVFATGPRYVASRQAQDRLHLQLFGRVIYVVVGLSIIVATVAAWRLGARWPAGLGPFAGLVTAGILANAVITGALSSLNPRYQARVIWLVPLLAYVLAIAWWDARETPGKETGLRGSDEQGFVA